MKLLSVNVSLPREVPHGGKTVTTGIFKEPVDGRVMLRRLNLDGDGQADLRGHGACLLRPADTRPSPPGLELPLYDEIVPVHLDQIALEELRLFGRPLHHP